MARLENAISGLMKKKMNHIFLRSLFFIATAILVATVIVISAQAEPAMIVNDGAVVFEQPDFDSQGKFQLHEGDKVEVSKRSFLGKNGMGAFVRVKLSNGQLGFISDAEFVRAGALAQEKKEKEKKEKKSEIPKKDNSRKKPFELTRYRGFNIEYVGYKEQTMGFQPMSNVVFYGFKMVGPNLLVEGDLVTELNVSLLPGTPPFYQEATGNAANGWVLHTDMMFQSVFPQTREIVTYTGFGPMFKYNHYNVALTSAGKTKSYDVEDMILGAVFNFGFGVRMGSSCLRAEFKYDWEKTQYWGIGTSLLFQF